MSPESPKDAVVARRGKSRYEETLSLDLIEMADWADSATERNLRVPNARKRGDLVVISAGCTSRI